MQKVQQSSELATKFRLEKENLEQEIQKLTPQLQDSKKSQLTLKESIDNNRENEIQNQMMLERLQRLLSEEKAQTQKMVESLNQIQQENTNLLKQLDLLKNHCFELQSKIVSLHGKIEEKGSFIKEKQNEFMKLIEE
jgi:aspartyl/asparaginyl beta-hydroxylase (cupin superfamily)